MTVRARVLGAIVAIAATVASVGPIVSAPAAAGPAAPLPPTLSWHDAGDSYAAGEGVSGNKGACAQSENAYGPAARRIVDPSGKIIKPAAFTACTGHLTEDFLNTRPGISNGSLAAWAVEQGLSDGRSDVLTVSFGGNDIGFAKIIEDCLPLSDWVVGGIVGGCDDSEQDIRARIDALLKPTARCTGGRLAGKESTRRDSTFGWGCDLLLDGKGTATPADDRRGSISDFYRLLIDEHLTDRGRLFVVGYPAIFAPIEEWPAWNAVGCAGVRWGDAEKLNRLTAYFDEQLAKAVKQADAGRGRATYISRRNLYREGGHELCGPGEDWMNGIALDRGPGSERRIETSFHPNAAGHAAVAKVLAAKVQAVDWNAPTGVTERQMRNLALPKEHCDYLDLPAEVHQLKNGEYTYTGPEGNQSTIAVGDVAVGDLDGDGVADGALTLMCANGVADHFTDVLVLLAASRRLLNVDLVRYDETLEPFSPDQESLTDANAVRIDGGKLGVDMTWTFLNDANCCPTTQAVGTYQIKGDVFVRDSLDVRDDRARTAELIAKINAGDRDGVDGLLVDGYEGSFDTYIDDGIKFEQGECVLPDILSDFRYCQMVAVGGDYTVSVEYIGTLLDRKAEPLVGD